MPYFLFFPSQPRSHSGEKSPLPLPPSHSLLPWLLPRLPSLTGKDSSKFFTTTQTSQMHIKLPLGFHLLNFSQALEFIASKIEPVTHPTSTPNTNFLLFLLHSILVNVNGATMLPGDGKVFLSSSSSLTPPQACHSDLPMAPLPLRGDNSAQSPSCLSTHLPKIQICKFNLPENKAQVFNWDKRISQSIA